MRFGFRARCRMSAGLLALVCMASGTGIAQAATLTGIRHSTTDERTRVVLDLNGASEYTHRVLADPPRIVVELPGGKLGSGVGDHPVGNGILTRVRINTLRSLQIVLDLEGIHDYTIFTLDNPPRLVIDVKHAGQRPVTPAPTAAETKTPAASGSAAKDPAPSAKTEPEEPPARAIPVTRPPVKGEWIVAIDAGHGGQDHGARHFDTSEKDITLALAGALKEELEKYPGVKVVLVRKGDYFIPLRRRWTLAEKQGAHLFVSLHCNASKDRDASGTEVYFLTLKDATDEAAQDLAQRENAVDEKMGVPAAETDLKDIIDSMLRADVLTKSGLLAEQCLDNLYHLGTVHGRGVKQAGFAVLKSPRMPSVLVEAAFISNRKENKMLRDAGWRREFSARLAEGIVAFVQSVEPVAKAER